MEPERWRQVEELYHASLTSGRAKPGGISARCLPGRCSHFASEVESLLTHEESAEKLHRSAGLRGGSPADGPR